MGNIIDSWNGQEFDNSPRFVLGGSLDRPYELNPMEIVLLNILTRRPHSPKRPYSHRKDNSTRSQALRREMIAQGYIYSKLEWEEE